MKIVVELDGSVPERLRRALRSLREVELTEAPHSRISIDGRAHPLAILPRPQPGSSSDPTPGVQHLASQVPRGAVGLVVAASIPRREREVIERAGLSWCDGRGALHVSWPGILVHIDHTAGRRAVTVRAEGEPNLGPAGIRALQVLLDGAEDEWTVSRLAHRAAISIGQAHNVLRALEENRLVTTTGKGPRQRRVISDRRAGLDWLATIDRARRRPEGAATYLYGRRQEDVLARLAESADKAGLSYAVTGAAGSLLLGVPVLSNIVVAHVRVSVLEAAEALDRLGLEHLDAEDAGRGMNLELWTDTGELGTFGSTEIGGVRVAPPIRVWLDMTREGGRNTDAAQLFREQVLERV